MSQYLWALQVTGTHFDTVNNYLTAARTMSNISESKYLWVRISESSFTVPEEFHIVMSPLGVIDILGWARTGWFSSWTKLRERVYLLSDYSGKRDDSNSDMGRKDFNVNPLVMLIKTFLLALSIGLGCIYIPPQLVRVTGVFRCSVVITISQQREI